MKKLLLIFACSLALIACGNQQKQKPVTQDTQETQETQETQISEQSQLEEELIPHIFHGMTKTLSVANILEDGEFAGFSEHKAFAVKYALYLDRDFLEIFDDDNQQHLFIRYLGCEESECNRSYQFSTFDRSVEHGFVEFNYTDDGRVLLIIDYPEYAMGYFLETYMPEEEFVKHLMVRYGM